MLQLRFRRSSSSVTLLVVLLLSLPAAAAERTARVQKQRPARSVSGQPVEALRNKTTSSRPSSRLAGGGPQTTALIGLIQGSVAPHSWSPTTFSPGAAGNPSPSAQQLVDIIQTNVQPPSWDVNGGQGTILIVPW